MGADQATAYGHGLKRGAPRRVRTASPCEVLCLFLFHLRLPKADAFSSTVILDEFNPGAFKRAADGRFIRQGNWNFPLDDLGPPYRGHADL